MKNVFKTYSAQPIVVERPRLSVEPYRCSGEEREMLRYAIQAYGFVLRRKLDDCAPKRFSFGEFAAAIGEVYDVQSGRHAAVVGLLLSLELTQSEIAGLPVAEPVAA